MTLVADCLLMRINAHTLATLLPANDPVFLQGRFARRRQTKAYSSRRRFLRFNWRKGR